MNKLEEICAAKREVVAARKLAIGEEQLALSNAQLVAARTRVTEARAKYEQIARTRAASLEAGAIPEALASNTMTALRAQLGAALSREADLTASLGARHPALFAAQAQVRDARRQIAEKRPSGRDGEQPVRAAAHRAALRRHRPSWASQASASSIASGVLISSQSPSSRWP